MPSFAEQRSRMVRVQLARRGIKAPRVLEAVRSVPRERFVSEELAERAHDDAARVWIEAVVE